MFRTGHPITPHRHPAFLASSTTTTTVNSSISATINTNTAHTSFMDNSIHNRVQEPVFENTGSTAITTIVSPMVSTSGVVSNVASTAAASMTAKMSFRLSMLASLTPRRPTVTNPAPVGQNHDIEQNYDSDQDSIISDVTEPFIPDRLDGVSTVTVKTRAIQRLVSAARRDCDLENEWIDRQLLKQLTCLDSSSKRTLTAVNARTDTKVLDTKASTSVDSCATTIVLADNSTTLAFANPHKNLPPIPLLAATAESLAPIHNESIQNLLGSRSLNHTQSLRSLKTSLPDRRSPLALISTTAPPSPPDAVLDTSESHPTAPHLKSATASAASPSILNTPTDPPRLSYSSLLDQNDWISLFSHSADDMSTISHVTDGALVDGDYQNDDNNGNLEQLLSNSGSRIIDCINATPSADAQPLPESTVDTDIPMSCVDSKPYFQNTPSTLHSSPCTATRQHESHALTFTAVTTAIAPRHILSSTASVHSNLPTDKSNETPVTRPSALALSHTQAHLAVNSMVPSRTSSLRSKQRPEGPPLHPYLMKNALIDSTASVTSDSHLQFHSPVSHSHVGYSKMLGNHSPLSPLSLFGNIDSTVSQMNDGLSGGSMANSHSGNGGAAGSAPLLHDSVLHSNHSLSQYKLSSNRKSSRKHSTPVISDPISPKPDGCTLSDSTFYPGNTSPLHNHLMCSTDSDTADSFDSPIASTFRASVDSQFSQWSDPLSESPNPDFCTRINHSTVRRASYASELSGKQSIVVSPTLSPITVTNASPLFSSAVQGDESEKMSNKWVQRAKNALLSRKSSVGSSSLTTRPISMSVPFLVDGYNGRSSSSSLVSALPSGVQNSLQSGATAYSGSARRISTIGSLGGNNYLEPVSTPPQSHIQSSTVSPFNASGIASNTALSPLHSTSTRDSISTSSTSISSVPREQWRKLFSARTLGVTSMGTSLINSFLRKNVQYDLETAAYKGIDPPDQGVQWIAVDYELLRRPWRSAGPLIPTNWNSQDEMDQRAINTRILLSKARRYNAIHRKSISFDINVDKNAVKSVLPTQTSDASCKVAHVSLETTARADRDVHDSDALVHTGNRITSTVSNARVDECQQSPNVLAISPILQPATVESELKPSIDTCTNSPEITPTTQITERPTLESPTMVHPVERMSVYLPKQWVVDEFFSMRPTTRRTLTTNTMDSKQLTEMSLANPHLSKFKRAKSSVHMSLSRFGSVRGPSSVSTAMTGNGNDGGKSRLKSWWKRSQVGGGSGGVPTSSYTDMTKAAFQEMFDPVVHAAKICKNQSSNTSLFYADVIPGSDAGSIKEGGRSPFGSLNRPRSVSSDFDPTRYSDSGVDALDFNLLSASLHASLPQSRSSSDIYGSLSRSAGTSLYPSSPLFEQKLLQQETEQDYFTHSTITRVRSSTACSENTLGLRTDEVRLSSDSTVSCPSMRSYRFDFEDTDRGGNDEFDVESLLGVVSVCSSIGELIDGDRDQNQTIFSRYLCLDHNVGQL
ncbi:hypothetical protein MT418_007586 [Batrachochytrium dendrobatidis]